MKKALWALLAFVAAAFPGAARASDIVVTDTLTGIVIGGDDSVGAFGGGNLAGDVVTYSFTADLTLLNSNAYHATDNSSYESLTDYAAEGSISESVTINGGTYSMTSTASPDLGELFFGGGGSQSSLAIDVEDLTSPYYPYLSADLPSASAFALGTVTNQAALESVLGNLQLGTDSGIDVFDNYGNADGLVVHFTGQTIAPEPKTWQLLALSCCGVALLKRKTVALGKARSLRGQ